MKARTAGGILAVLFLGGWIYFPALHGGWLWDDVVDIAGNPVVHDPSGWWKIWITPSGWHFFPLKTTVQWAQWQLWHEHTTGYHLTNLLLHVSGALLVWRLLWRLGVRHGWIAALLFVAHPIAVESVAWIAELKNTLSLPLLLLSALAWIDYDENGRRRDYAWALVWFAAAMLAKSSVVMFPLCLLLFAAWKRGTLVRRDVFVTLPFFALSFGLGLVTVWFERQQDPAVQALMPNLGSIARVEFAGRALGFYFSKCVVPIDLAPVYPSWPVTAASIWWVLPWIAAVGLAVVARRNWNRWGRHIGFAGGFFLLNLIPVLGFVPMAYHHIAWVADHFTYVSLIGVVVLAAAAIGYCDQRTSGAARWTGRICAAAVIAWFAVESRSYARAFRDEETFWTHAIAVQPDAWLAHHDLAFLYARTGRPDDAIAQYQKSLQLQAGNADAENNLANALLAKGRVDESIAAYRRAIGLRPSYLEAQANLGNALARAGRTAEASAASERALRLQPDYAPAHLTLGDLASQAGHTAEAASHYAAALKQRPDDPLLLNNQATVLLQMGRHGAAIELYERAIKLAPAYVEARVNLGYAFIEQGDEKAAIAAWNEALRLAPATVAAHVGLGNVLVQGERPAEAEAHYRAAMKQQPADAEVRNNLAFALAQQGRIDEAIRECEEAIRLRPDYAAAKENLAKLKAYKK